MNTTTSQPDITPKVSEVTDPTPQSLTVDRLETLLQMQKTDPFCKRIFKHLSNSKADITPKVSEVTDPTPQSLTVDRLETLLQMQKTDPFCKRIFKHFSNSKGPQHESDLFTYIKGLLYKDITDYGKKFLAIFIPKSWIYTVLVEVHDKLGHQGNTHTYCLIKCQYYWKGRNNDIRKYTTNCTLFHREKSQSPSLSTSDDKDFRQTI